MSNKLAVFVCGSGGSGKTTFVNKHFGSFNQVNVDIAHVVITLMETIIITINK